MSQDDGVRGDAKHLTQVGGVVAELLRVPAVGLALGGECLPLLLRQAPPPVGLGVAVAGGRRGRRREGAGGANASSPRVRRAGGAFCGQFLPRPPLRERGRWRARCGAEGTEAAGEELAGCGCG